MHLSEYCVKSADGERLPVTCEEDVYRHLGMKYQQPHERTSA
jgi:DNA polymerase/3'-5' exonuclease PolX